MPLKLFLAFLLTAFTGAAQAHGARTDVLVTLEAPTATPGLTLQLHQGGIAPQLVLENRSGKILELDDAHGRPFLRIGPAGVEADTGSAAWKDSLNPVGASADGDPRWRTIRREPAYGWFDRRLDPEPLQIPRAIAAVGRAAPFGTWSMPARLGDQPLDIRGRFIYQPPPQGRVETVLRSAAEIAPGLRLELAQGRVPALLLRNDSRSVVEVLDAAGGILHRLHPGQRKTWLEPRAAYAGTPPAGTAKTVTLGRWEIPLRVGEKTLKVHGTHEWRPRQ